MKTKKTTILLLICLAALTMLAGCGKGGFDANEEISVISREDGLGTRGAFVELFGIDQKNANGEKVDYTVINTLSEKAKAKNIRIDFSGDTSLVNGIKPLLYEMVYNLCDNAINYNKENGSVTVKLLNENRKIKLSVSDTGIGIAPEHQDCIFERFYRVDKSQSKDTGGTRLGLAIVKHAAILHKAEIALESQVDYGTAIAISFTKSA